MMQCPSRRPNIAAGSSFNDYSGCTGGWDVTGTVARGGSATADNTTPGAGGARIETITDGASNTYLGGEGYLRPEQYISYTTSAYSGLWAQGCATPLSGTATWLAANTSATDPNVKGNNHPGFQDGTFAGDNVGNTFTMCSNFGSAHPTACNMLFCDYSVHRVSYMIDPCVNYCLGGRADGQPVDAKKATLD
jgi:hypothetical protein